MKKLMALTLAMMLFCGAALAEEEKNVTFPFGLTGYETIEECGERLSEIFGEPEYKNTDTAYTLKIETNYKLYNMTVTRVLAEIGNPDYKNLSLIHLDMFDTADISGINDLLDIFVFATENYGNRFDSTPISNQIDLNGNSIMYTLREEVDQIKEAILAKEKFEYTSHWMTLSDDETWLFVLKVNGYGTSKFGTTLAWFRKQSGE